MIKKSYNAKVYCLLWYYRVWTTSNCSLAVCLLIQLTPAVLKLHDPRSVIQLVSISIFHSIISYLLRTLFTARCYASAVLAMGLCLSVCLSVRPSVTSRSSTKTAKRRITQTTPHDSPGTLVFWSQRSPRNSTGVTPFGGAKCRWGGSKSSTFNK